MPRGNQVVRQWRLLQLVSRPRGLTIADAARELECSGRTMWRDLADLQAAGFPIYDDRTNGSRAGVYRVESSFQNRLPLPIALDEVVALLMSERLLAPAGPSPVGPALASLITKVRALLAPRTLEIIQTMGPRIGARALHPKLQGDPSPPIFTRGTESRASMLSIRFAASAGSVAFPSSRRSSPLRKSTSGTAPGGRSTSTGSAPSPASRNRTVTAVSGG